MRRGVAILVLGLLAAACAHATTPDKYIGPGAGGSSATGGSGGSGAGGAATGGAGGTATGGAGGTATGGAGGTATGGAGGTATGGAGGTATGGAGGTATGGAGGSGGATKMDPGLVLPNPGGTPCNHPGSSAGCGSLEVCRISGPDSGRCESCDTCGNLNSFCTTDRECDILFQCYQHRCTNICPLGSSYCGAVQDCLDVGNSTYGVCKP